MTLIYIIIGCLIGAGLIAIILIPKIKNKIEYDENTLKANNVLKEKNSILLQTNTNLNNKKEELQDLINQITLKKTCLEKEVEKSQIKREEIEKSIDIIQQQAKNTADEYLQSKIKIAKEKVNIEEEKLKKTLEQYKKDVNDEYLIDLQEACNQLQVKTDEIVKANNKLQELQDTISTAIELEQRKQADEMAELKYKITLSDEDLIEINRLREVAPFLRNSRPVYKIIWEGYYRNPTNDLINRVIGLNNATGIYRLTNTINNMSYIGQAANISDRWKQHIKCGLGIDTPNSLLYKGMLTNGVENFKFEIIKTCSRDKLNEREKYWINFYKTEEYGYNMTKGNK